MPFFFILSTFWSFNPLLAQQSSNKEVIGYFTAWSIYGRDYRIKDVNDCGAAGKLTVINYAFGDARPDNPGDPVKCYLIDPWADYQIRFTSDQSVDGVEDTWSELLRGNFHQLKKLKTMYPDLKVVISLGGWSNSKYFSDASLTAQARQVFVQSCIDLFIHGDLPDESNPDITIPGLGAGVFDGIDIDWEYPASPGDPANIYRPEDTQNFTLLLEEFRNQLDAVNPDLLLTIAAPAASSKYDLIELDQIHPYLDYIQLMTYDFHGSWDGSTNFHSNLYASSTDPSNPPFSTDSTVQGYLSAGSPPGKLVLGLPFYGRGWQGVADVNGGLYQSATGPAPATWEAGFEDYKVLKTLESSGYTRTWHDEARAPWLFNGDIFWAYDDEESVCEKMAYINQTGLAGAMFWSVDGDDDQATLVTAIVDCLTTDILLYLTKNPAAPDGAELTWSGGSPPYDVFRGHSPVALQDVANRIVQDWPDLSYVDPGPTPLPIAYYSIDGVR
ncbi:glycoside hydrolase family 18 protein [Acidobacteriota bacterium]